MNREKLIENRKRIANIVKKNMWANNVRATIRGQEAGTVLMLGKYLVWCTEDQGADPAAMPKRFKLLALVYDYGDFSRVRIFNRKGKQLRAAFYHYGRLGQKVAC